MILIAGAGGMAEAARAMRRIQRDANRHAQRRRDRRDRRKAKRALANANLDLDYEPATTDFPCDFLCMNCSYLLDHERYDEENPPPCPGCGEKSWLDLKYEELAASVRDMEFESRMRIPTGHRVVALGVIGLPTAITTTFIVVLSLASAGVISSTEVTAASLVFGLLSILLFGPIAWFVGARAVSVYLASDLATEPMRWRLSNDTALYLPKIDHDASKDAAVLADSETIAAPFSGRECVAFEAGVLFDTPGDSRPAQWVLREQRAVDVTIDGETIAADRISVDGVPGEVPIDVLLDADHELTDEEKERVEEFRRYLRKRGLFLADGDYWAYEIVVVPGANCAIAEVEGLYVLTPTSEMVTD